MGASANAGVTAQAARELLGEGNARYVEQRPTHPRQDEVRRREVLPHQAPFAVVVSCSDSRVPPELLFDQGLGDLFCVRTAGHVLDAAALASIEYAVAHLGVPLVVVLGHSHCGAVRATLDHLTAPGQLPGNLSALVWAISPAAREARRAEGDVTGRAVELHVQATMARLAESRPILADALSRGDLAVAGAVYDLESGVVRWL